MLFNSFCLFHSVSFSFIQFHSVSFSFAGNLRFQNSQKPTLLFFELTLLFD